ncbi:MAG: cadherin-like domain-containing protein [Spirochaetales bacterium]|nr:cadherin-like domain-containing protein [Spirochaetales bacterium]
MQRHSGIFHSRRHDNRNKRPQKRRCRLSVHLFSCRADALDHIDGTGSTWSFDVTPRSNGLVILNIPSDVASDIAGNGNLTLSDTFDYTYNSNQIALNFFSSSSLITNDPVVTVTMTFDLEMDENDLLESELSLSGGELSHFQKISDSVYTVDLINMTEGTVSLTVPADSASRTFGRTNPLSGDSFTCDGAGPDIPLFEVREILSRDPVASDAFANEILELGLISDYSGDLGLTFEYTTDNGSTWLPYSNPRYIAADGTYAGINIRVTDEAGNLSEGTAVTNISIDSIQPDSPLVNIISDPVNASNYMAFSFAVSGGEPGFGYSYELDSSGGGSLLTGTGVLDGSGEALVSGLDTSELNDGVLTLQVRLTDLAENQSGIGQDQVEKDTLLPSAPIVIINSSDPVTSADNDSFSFSVTGGEEGASYSYTISSDSGGAVLEGTGTLVDNGDGTVTYQVPGPSFYGIDEFTYQVSDGTNISIGTIRFDVVP